MASNKLAAKVAELAPNDGLTETGIPGVRLYRVSEPELAQPVVYEPCIVIVAQGQKRGYLGEQTFVYDQDNYLVMSVPVPFMCEVTRASVETPFLAISVAVEVPAISDLMMEMVKCTNPGSAGPASSEQAPMAVVAGPMDEAILNVSHRILDSLGHPDDARVLGPLFVKELMFRILKSEQGQALRAIALQNSRFHHISRVMKFMQGNYLENCTIDTLASMANMSPSSFHHHFKAVTASSPVQYLKQIRLHQARSLLLQGGITASSAAQSVGYASGSQFSREYKRFFGVAPRADLERVR